MNFAIERLILINESPTTLRLGTAIGLDLIKYDMTYNL